MSKKIDKHDLKEPDAFLTFSEQVFKHIEKHGKLVLGLAVAIVLVSVIYVGVGYYNSSTENKAANEIYKAEALLKKAQSDVREDRAKKVGDLSTKKGDPGMVRPADFDKDFASLVDGVKAQIQKYSDTRSALVSALNLSYFLVEQKQYGLAENVLGAVKYRPSSSDLLNGFLLMHHGLAELASGKLDQAQKSYQEVVDNKGLKDFQPQALLKLGVVYQVKGDFAKAREAFEKVAKEFPDTEASNSAQNYMRLLALKAGKQG